MEELGPGSQEAVGAQGSQEHRLARAKGQALGSWEPAVRASEKWGLGAGLVEWERPAEGSAQKPVPPPGSTRAQEELSLSRWKH